MAQEQSRVELKFDDDLQKPGFWRIGRTEGGNITFFGFCFTRICSRQRSLRASNSSSALAGLSTTLYLPLPLWCKPLHTHTHRYTQVQSAKYKEHQHCCDTATERKTEKGNHYWQDTIFFKGQPCAKCNLLQGTTFLLPSTTLCQLHGG